MPDLTNQTRGRWRIVSFSHKDKYANNVWNCECECGTKKQLTTSYLNRKSTISCGCYSKEIKTKHGMSRTKLFRAWWDMRQRCYGSQKQYIKHYQNRGVTVCDEWKDSFEAFRDWAISNGYEEGLTLDRIDVNGNYEPSNCRWATQEQQANNRTDSHYITIEGQTKTIADWAKDRGINKSSIFARLQNGWSEYDAVMMPIDEKYSTGKMLELNGKKQNISDWARELGITAQSIEFRLESGWSLEEALTTPKRKGNYKCGTLIEFNGKKQNIKEWAKETGISHKSISWRLNHGWSVDEALSTPRVKDGYSRFD